MRTQECKIRPWRLDDAESVAIAINNPKVLDNLRDGIPFPYSVQDGVEYISSMLSADKERIFAFAITIDDCAIGSISAEKQSNIHHRTAEIGYFIAEKHWGEGITTSAVRQICEYLFANTHIMRLYAMPFADNIASCRVLEKVGFMCEGVLRSCAVKNGKVRDMKIYSLIKSESHE